MGGVAAIKESPLKPLCLGNNALCRPSLCGMLMRTAQKLHDSLARGGGKRGCDRSRGSGMETLVSRCQAARQERWQKVHINFETFLKYIFGCPRPSIQIDATPTH